jgi:hypothetical protein
MAAKANGEISPAASLLLAAKAIAVAFHVQHVVGVSTERHIACGYEREKLSLSYDDMWLKVGGTRVGEGFFLLTPGTQRPLKDISIPYRRRTRRKRILQGELQDAVRLSVLKTFRSIELNQNELLTAGGISQTGSRQLQRSASGYWLNIISRSLLEVRAFCSSILALRGPVLPKLVFIAGLVYPFCPIDIIPDSHIDEIFSVISGLVGSWLLMNAKGCNATRDALRPPLMDKASPREFNSWATGQSALRSSPKGVSGGDVAPIPCELASPSTSVAGRFSDAHK